MKTTDLTVRNDTDLGCWIAFDGKSLDDCTTVGEGFTAQAAIADFWFAIHAGKTASLLEPYDNGTDRWALHDGTYVVRFDTREEAVAYGEAHQYITSPFVKEV